MSLRGNIASFGWESLLGLLSREDGHGTLSVEGEDERIDLLFQGGLVVVPIPVHDELGRSRDHDSALANQALSRALTWRLAAFRFEPGVLPQNFMARRAIVLKPKRLREVVDLLRFRRSAEESPGFRMLRARPLDGRLESVRLKPLLRLLRRERRSGRLIVRSGEHELRLRLRDGKADPLPGHDRDASKRVLRAAQRWREGRFRFEPEVVIETPAADERPGARTQRIVLSALESEVQVQEPAPERPARKSARWRRARGRGRRGVRR